MMDEGRQNWVRLFNMARDHAANELHLSNELLSVIDAVNQLTSERVLSESQAAEITIKLMNVALKLSEQSKQMSVSVWKLVGE